MPFRCTLCAAPTAGDTLCAPCVRDLPWRMPALLRLRPGAVDYASFRYAFPLPEFIGRAKLAGDCGLARQIGQLMASRPPVGAGDFDVVCAVPLPYLRAVRRGYNQALEIARPIAARLALPLSATLLERHGGRAQRGLNRADRQRNIAQSLTAGPRARGQRVLLIDDVTTTGATLREASRALYAAGAARVVGWAAAAVD